MKKVFLINLFCIVSFSSIGVDMSKSNIGVFNSKNGISFNNESNINANYIKTTKSSTKVSKPTNRASKIEDINKVTKTPYNKANDNKTNDNKEILSNRKLSNKYVSSSFLIANLKRYIKEYLGVKYIFGGTTNKGIDCSAFTKNVYKDLGVTIPRVSYMQYDNARKINSKDAKLGDLVFFKTTNKHTPSHVGIYLGNGKFIHASSRAKKVQINKLEGYYLNKFYAFGRYLY